MTKYYIASYRGMDIRFRYPNIEEVPVYEAVCMFYLSKTQEHLDLESIEVKEVTENTYLGSNRMGATSAIDLLIRGGIRKQKLRVRIKRRTKDVSTSVPVN